MHDFADTDLRWLRLLPGDLGSSLTEELATAMAEFRSLRFPAAVRAADWLQTVARERCTRYETHVVLDGTGRALGFYAIETRQVELYGSDPHILGVRGLIDRVRPRKPETVPCSFVPWLARASVSAPGFGGTLFTHAVGNALDRDTVAVVARPHDDETSAVLRRQFRLHATADPPDEQRNMLWLPVVPANPSWPS